MFFDLVETLLLLFYIFFCLCVHCTGWAKLNDATIFLLVTNEHIYKIL